MRLSNLSGPELNRLLLEKYCVSLYDFIYTAWNSGLNPKFRTRLIASKSEIRMVERLERRLEDERYSRRSRKAYYKKRIERLRENLELKNWFILQDQKIKPDSLTLEEAQRQIPRLKSFLKNFHLPLREKQRLHNLCIVWGGFFQPLGERVNQTAILDLISWLYRKTKLKAFSSCSEISLDYLKTLNHRLAIGDYKYFDTDRIDSWRKDFFSAGESYPVFEFTKDGDLQVRWEIFRHQSQPAIIFPDSEIIACEDSGWFGREKIAGRNLREI